MGYEGQRLSLDLVQIVSCSIIKSLLLLLSVHILSHIFTDIFTFTFTFSMLLSKRLTISTFVRRRETIYCCNTVNVFIETNAKHLQALGSLIPRIQQDTMR